MNPDLKWLAENVHDVRDDLSSKQLEQPNQQQEEPPSNLVGAFIGKNIHIVTLEKSRVRISNTDTKVKIDLTKSQWKMACRIANIMFENGGE